MHRSENYLDARLRAAATLKLVHTRFIASTDAHLFRSIYLHASAATFDGYILFWDRLTHPAVIMHLRDLSLEAVPCAWPETRVLDLADFVAEREVLIEGIFDTIERIQDLLLDGEVPGPSDFDPVETPLTAGRFMKLHSISVTDFAFTLLLPHLVSLAPWLQEIHISQESLPYTKSEISEALNTLARLKEPTAQPGKRIRLLEVTHFGSPWIVPFLRYWNILPERLTLVSSCYLWEGRDEDYRDAVLKVADWTGFEAFDLLQNQLGPRSATWDIRQRFADSLAKNWVGRRIKMQIQVFKRNYQQQIEDEDGELLQRPEMLEFVT